ncbi:MAG TPA: Crp/Fnr family transcriptional regulator [Desulfobacteraceae bacterium]|nr:Crp/Fnr family transcriptional regulator [Desulfobacteraceae bacterium]
MDIVGHIASVPLFEGLPRENLRDLVTILVEQLWDRGRLIFSEGDEGSGFYVVISGRVKIYKLSPEGKEQTLHIFGPGEPFGEVPVFTGRNFPANAETMEKSRLFFFPRDAFIDLIRKNPSLALNMLAILSRRLRRFTTLVEGLSLKEVPGRLAAYLLYLSQQNMGVGDLELNITKGQLASLLGTIPETLSRILGKMSAQGLIETDGRRIKIMNREGLEDLAEWGRF